MGAAESSREAVSRCVDHPEPAPRAGGQGQDAELVVAMHEALVAHRRALDANVGGGTFALGKLGVTLC